MSLEKIEAWVENAVKNVLTFLGVLKTDALKVLATGTNIVTALINFIQSPTGTTIEEAVAAFVPQLHIAEFVESFLPVLFVDLKWATAEAGKTNAQIITDGLTYLASLTGSSKVGQWTTFAMKVGLWLAEKLGIVITPQQAVTVIPSIVNPALGVVAEAPAIDPHLSGKDAVAETVKDAIPAQQATAEAGTEQAEGLQSAAPATEPGVEVTPPASATGIESDTSNGAV